MIRVALLLAASLMLAGAVAVVDPTIDVDALRHENEKLAAENVALLLRIDELMTAKEECLESIDMLRNPESRSSE